MATSDDTSAKTNILQEWFMSQYRGSVAIDTVEGGTNFKKMVAQFPKNSAMTAGWPLTGRARVMRGFLSLKVRYPLGPDGYSCLVMGARAGGAWAHYAYAYWRRGAEAAPPEYICIAPTFDSRDGEFRHRFLRAPLLLEACAAHASELAPFEELTIAMVASGALELETSAYPEGVADPVGAQANASRLPVLAFACALALDLGRPQFGHTSKAYTTLMEKIAAVWRPAAATRLADETNSFWVLLKRGSPLNFDIQCGQKLIPMYAREAMQVADCNLAVWRELAVTQLASDLVLNFITPGCALYNQWTFVEGADAGAFENPAMKGRYARGGVVEVSMRSLREARRALGAAGAGYHAEELSARMYESLAYAQSFLLMSPVAIVHTMENAGWPMREVAGFSRQKQNPYPNLAGVFASPGGAARHIFDCAYAAHCLHSKAGVAHTDLHGNNMTANRWGVADRRGAPLYDDPVVAYVTGPRGEADTYVFPASGVTGCLIDYSRCILGPAFRPRLEAGRSPQYATNFYRDQVNRVMRALHRYAPEYVAAHQDALKGIVLANFEAVFPVLCAVDFIAIGASFGALLADAARPAPAGGGSAFTVCREAAPLALRLEEVGRELLITGLHGLAEPGAGAGGRARPAEFPGTTALARVFGDWRYPRWAAESPERARTAQLVDAYNYNNPLRYSGADYARFPPWARFDEIERHLGGHKISDLFGLGAETFLESLHPGARAEVVADQIRTAQERLDGPPVASMSSWLDE